MPQASSKPYQISKMMRCIEKPGIVRTVCPSISKYIQGCLEILMHIHPHSQACRYWGEGGFPFFFCFFFFENRKKVLFSFWEKGSDGFHLCVKLSIQNVVLRVSKRKNLQNAGPFFSCVFDETFIKVPQFPKTSPALKDFWLRACTQALFFLQIASL